MSPVLNESSVICCFECNNAIEICEGIIFHFYTGLPHTWTGPPFVRSILMRPSATRSTLTRSTLMRLIWHKIISIFYIEQFWADKEGLWHRPCTVCRRWKSLNKNVLILLRRKSQELILWKVDLMSVDLMAIDLVTPSHEQYHAYHGQIQASEYSELPHKLRALSHWKVRNRLQYHCTLCVRCEGV